MLSRPGHSRIGEVREYLQTISNVTATGLTGWWLSVSGSAAVILSPPVTRKVHSIQTIQG